MTKELLEQRIKELKDRQTAILADLNAIGGAIQDCEFWLWFIEHPPTASEKDANEAPTE